MKAAGRGMRGHANSRRSNLSEASRSCSEAQKPRAGAGVGFPRCWLQMMVELTPATFGNLRSRSETRIRVEMEVTPGNIGRGVKSEAEMRRVNKESVTKLEHS